MRQEVIDCIEKDKRYQIKIGEYLYCTDVDFVCPYRSTQYFIYHEEKEYPLCMCENGER